MSRRIALLLVLLLGCAPLAGCTTNPATGGQSFTGLVSTKDEIATGKKEHPQVVKAFGGEYDDPALTAYVSSVGALLARTVERKDLTYHFTVLNSDIVNAFAMPGGYIYISRGLLALASNEAELAAVLAHELGHVNALHYARRQSTGILAKAAMLGVGLLLGGEAMQPVGSLAQAALMGYSRDQEREADSLGIRYMSRAGYDPTAMPEFLAKLRANSRLDARLRGESPDEVDAYNYLATHPAPEERVETTAKLAAATHVDNPIRAEAIYLGKIDGMLYGSDPAEGVIRGREFAHPKLGITFEVPRGFYMINGRNAVGAIGPGGARIIFDRAKRAKRQSPRAFLVGKWAKGASLKNVETIRINGVPAATGATQIRGRNGVADVRLVAIAWDAKTFYRFIFLTPPKRTKGLSEDLRRTTYSFRALTKQERQALKPLRISVKTVGPGDTPKSLSRDLPFARGRLERFDVLNGLAKGDTLHTGALVKLVR